MIEGIASVKITADEIARLKGESLNTVQKRLRRGCVPFEKDASDSRRKLYDPARVLTASELARWVTEQESPAPAEQSGPHEITLASSNSLQPVLPFDVSPSYEARQEAVAAIPERFRPQVEKTLGLVSECVNGTWKKVQGLIFGGVLVRNNDDFRHGLAKVHGVSYSFVNGKLQLFRSMGKDWKVFAESLVPKPRPGRSGHTFFDQPGNEWMLGKLRDFYLNQAQHSMHAAHSLLLAEIAAKQRAWGIGHIYDPPTLDQCRTALKRISKPVRVMARQGEKAFSDQCGMYISRNPDTLRANDLWVTDQKEVDVRLRDGVEHLGRIWMVNFLDVASDKVLGFAFGPVLSSDMVMMAACMAIERFGVPRAVHMDLGKEFICQAFNGKVRRFSGETLYREASGLWKSLAVEPVKAIGRNPQSKTIERWHANLPAFDRNFPGYCGSSPDSRPEKLATEEAQHLAWLADKKGTAPHTPLVSIPQYIHAYINWVENTWNAQARGCGKMRRGMTPNEAYNAKRPADGFRTITIEELDHHSAEHRFVKIARGGQVNLTFFGQLVEYIAPELFLHQGEECEVIISRRTFRQVTVIYPITGGTASCVATLKPQLAWLPENRDELRAAMRCKAAVHRAIRQGVKASKVALAAANPVALLEQQKVLPAKDIIGPQKFFDAPVMESQHPEVGSVEYMATRHKRAGYSRSLTSEEVAREMTRMEKEDAPNS